MLTKDQKAQVYENLKGLVAVFEVEKTKEVLSLYVESLSEFDFVEINKAIKWAITNCKFFPKPVELLERINPKPDAQDAMSLAGEIIECITRFGYMQGDQTRKVVGETGWRAIQMAGGWQLLCDTPTSQIGQLRAQLRDLCLTSMNRPEIDSRRQRIAMASGERLGQSAPQKPGLKLLFGSDALGDEQ